MLGKMFEMVHKKSSNQLLTNLLSINLWQGSHGRAVAQPLKERVQLDYHLSTTWAQLMSVQGYNTFIQTRLLGNKWQYENDLSDVIGVCTEFIWNNKVTTTEWLQLAQQWQMSCCDVIFCWCCYKLVTVKVHHCQHFCLDIYSCFKTTPFLMPNIPFLS